MKGTAIEPLPYGQIPAMARNKVDLPAPDGPVTKVRSWLLILKRSAASSGVPLGNLTRSCLRSILSLPVDATISIEPGPVGWAAALLIAISNPSRRATTDRHSASVRYVETKNDSACCTLEKAFAVCIMPPSWILSAKYAGATRTYGKTTAACE